MASHANCPGECVALVGEAASSFGHRDRVCGVRVLVEGGDMLVCLEWVIPDVVCDDNRVSEVHRVSEDLVASFGLLNALRFVRVHGCCLFRCFGHIDSPRSGMISSHFSAYLQGKIAG